MEVLNASTLRQWIAQFRVPLVALAPSIQAWHPQRRFSGSFVGDHCRRETRSRFPLFPFIPNGVLFPNPAGASQTHSTTGGGIDQTGPFFQSLGTNGRSCATCHQPSDGMSVSAAGVELRFLLTQGQDPISALSMEELRPQYRRFESFRKAGRL